MTNPAGASLVGRSARVERTFGQSDLVQFGRLSGDDHPLHVDPDYARQSGFEGTIVQGALITGLMAAASTAFFRDLDRPAVSYGYDRMRFTRPVAAGEPLVAEYRVTAHDLEAGKSWADVRVTAAGGAVAAVAVHVAKFL